MDRLGTSLLLAVSLISLSACGTRTVLKPNPQPKTSYELLVPKPALRYSLEPGETAIRPELDKQLAPVYPSSLVRPDAPPVTVVVQLVVDKAGRVEGVYPVSNTGMGTDRALFEAAVEHAAVQWTFTPLWMRQPKPDGTYLQIAKPFSLWYVFHFKIINGKPIVETVKR
jgi:outer membrane biosynthesis protein TonB